MNSDFSDLIDSNIVAISDLVQYACSDQLVLGLPEINIMIGRYREQYKDRGFDLSSVYAWHIVISNSTLDINDRNHYSKLVNEFIDYAESKQ